MTFSTKQILNVLTGVLHTKMDDIYEFFDKLIEPGIMTHMLPRAAKALKPILIRKFPNFPIEGFHPNIPDGQHDITLTKEEKAEFWKNYEKLPNPLEGKNIIAVKL